MGFIFIFSSFHLGRNTQRTKGGECRGERAAAERVVSARLCSEEEEEEEERWGFR